MSSARMQSSRLTVDAIAAALRGEPRVAQWQVEELRTRRFERYLTFLATESEREVAMTRWRVWLALPARDGRQGEAAFTLGPDDADALRARLAEAVAAAEAAPNPAWTLPAPGATGVATAAAAAVSPVDRALIDAPLAALDGLERAFADAARAAPWTRPSALELFATVEERRLANHAGLALAGRRTRLYAEFVLLHRPAGGDEVEFFEKAEAATVDGLDLARRVGEAAACVRDRARAAPTPGGRLPVILAGDALAELVGWFEHHADAAMHVRGIAAYAEGDAVVVRRGGEPLTVVSDPAVPSLAAYAFDEHGYAAARQELVAGDRLVGLCGDGRWMQALGRVPRGQAGTLVVPAGGTPLADLRRAASAPGVLEVVRFSEFQPRADTGAFSGEIRLAWLHRPDGSLLPVQGGSVSGVIRDALADARFSAETATTGGYAGPRAVRLEAVTVAPG